jgi:hypothetical protein
MLGSSDSSTGPSATSPAADRPDDEEQNHGSDEGDHDGAEQPHRALDEEPEQEAPDHGATTRSPTSP